ncbi:oligopeptide/dipeptide ABC transporter ATP-binding protein [Salinicola rhizosphaerae]|uniref:ABC transporter ATP-binding protein n=1 Tax=Salinicola rhizosphaerae TaxID=1443141 RepID=A0ABQ3DRI2_9GAMM|nr:ABC transporter ATP-binding protein [Salinicola rhizosphaerae]
MSREDALAGFGRSADQVTPLLDVRHLHHRFMLPDRRRLCRRGRRLQALDDVTLTLQRGDALCVVGESGSGKSTLARAIMGLLAVREGEIRYDGERIDQLSARRRLPYRRRMQMIFQDPHASLNPRLTLRQTLEEPLHVHFPTWSRSDVTARARSLMQDVGLNPDWGERYAHELSGGQRQRVAIARALSVDPEFIVADEPVSALDLSVQAQVLNLLLATQVERRLTYLFITHDLAVVEHFATRVAVMYRGTLCEVADADTLFATPRHPYTQALLESRPRFDDAHAARHGLRGEPMADSAVRHGCVFRDRCPYAMTRCERETPVAHTLTDGRRIACHAVEEARI